MTRVTETPRGVAPRVMHVLISVDSVRGGPVSVVQTLQAMDQSFWDSSEIVSTSLAARPDAYLTQVQTFKPSRRFAKLHLSPALVGSLWRTVRRCDLVQIHEIFAFPPLAAMVIAAMQRRPYVLWPHGSLDPVDLEKHRVAKRLMSPILRLLISRAQEVWVVGPGEGSRADLFGAGTPIRVVSPVIAQVPEEDLGESSRQSDRVILFMGRLHPIKQLENLIDAFGRVSLPGERLVICGEGEPAYQTALKRRARRVPNGGRIIFAGWAHGRDKWRLLRDAELVVLPSRRESFGVVVVEALAVGTPVLTTTGVPLLSEDDDFTYRCGTDATSLADAMRGALDDPHLAARGIAGRDFVEREFGIDALGEKYLQAVMGVARRP